MSNDDRERAEEGDLFEAEPGTEDGTAAAPAGPPIRLESGGYQVQIDVYDGPLDLLLHLIRKEELNIFDIEISKLTSAYLSSLKAMQRAGIEPASEFLLMAATLTHLKSRSLLPKPKSDGAGDEDDLDPRTELMYQLLAYQVFKEAAQHLGGETRLGHDVFNRPSGQDRPVDDEQVLTGHDIYRLAMAFKGVLKRDTYQAPHEIYVERITIGERIAQIADGLSVRGSLSFHELIEEQTTREEVITTFLAILEMARLNLIGVEQRGPQTPLYLSAKVEKIAERGEVAAGMLAE